MLDMSKQSGYEAEPLPEVPDGRQQYLMIPNFTGMLDEFGDWIAYKLRCLLQTQLYPEDWFIIHPDEAQSTAMVNKMQVTYDQKLTVIRIPRPLITEAQRNGNSWEKVLQKRSGAPLVQEIESVSNSSGLIVDIFWGSGSTCTSLEALLNYFGIVPFAYLSLVDFEPNEQNSTSSGLPKYSLYQWYNPRTLLSVGG